MSHHPSHRAPRGALPRRAAATLVAVGLGLTAVAAVPPASAVTSVDPVEAGSPPVVRDFSVTLKADLGALSYYRLSTLSSFTAQTHSLGGLTAVCRGDVAGGTNSSPRTTFTVTAPGGATVLTSVSPVVASDLASLLASPKGAPLSPQPAPAAANYRGDFRAAANDNTVHGFSTKLDLTGKPAGVYTVTTTTQNMFKTGLGTCGIGKPGPDGKTVVTGPEVSTQTFEYRPWSATFVDVLGAGKVSANTTPAEFTFSVGSKKSAIYAGDVDQTFYALPSGTLALPSDPSTCTADLASCLPPTAVPCKPASGCVPRLMVVNKPDRTGDPDTLIGVFDLDTKAFIAYARVGGSVRTLMSLGTANDSLYGDLLAQLTSGAAAQGVDLASILATKVTVGDGAHETSLSLLNGLQIDPSSGKGGVRISTGATAHAGVVLDVYSSLRLAGGPCVANTASSATAPGRFTRKEDNGYTVTKSDLLPKVPAVGPLGAIAGGPVYHVTGTFKPDALVNTASAVIGVDTATNEPNGYPVWIQPFISSPMHVAKPKTMDFVGTATWSASETPVAQGCLVVDFMLGTGVAVYDNPLPVGLGTILDPLATPSPEAQQLTDAVTNVVDQVTGKITADPTVSALLTQITDLLPLA